MKYFVNKSRRTRVFYINDIYDKELSQEFIDEYTFRKTILIIIHKGEECI